jgi:hypothetical protein
MTDTNGATFRLLDPHGATIATGSYDALLERLPQSLPRMNAEQAIAAAAKAVAREQRLDARADSLDRREAEVQAREDAIFADSVRKFAEGVAEVARRLDSIEQKRNQAALDALPDPDFPGKDDYLPPAEMEPPADKDREQLEVMLEREHRDSLLLRHEDADGDPGQIPALPSSLKAAVGQPFEGGRLPENSMFPVKHDSYVCGRDRKAARRRMQQLQGLQA